MALTESTRPYETLIRHNADGTIAAQHQRISEILSDGVIVAATVQPPLDITHAKDGGLDLDAVIGEAAASALLNNEKLKEKVTALNDRVSSLLTQVADLTAKVASATALSSPASSL